MKDFFILAVFFAAYAGIVFKRERALYFLYAAVLIFLFFGAVALADIPYLLNYNVLGIFLGTSALSFLFAVSGVPALIVEKISAGKYSLGTALLLVCAITGAISIFVENIATIMIMAPVAFELAKKHRFSPVSLLVGMSVSSNIQGCATMVGDSPSIILAMESGMTFNDFFYMPPAKLSLESGRPGLFFFVQAGALAGLFVLYFFFRKEKKLMESGIEKRVDTTFVPVVLIFLMVCTLALGSFLNNGFRFFPAAVCLFYGAAGLFWFAARGKKKKFLFSYIDWDSFFLLAGLFILVGALKKAGFIEALAGFMERGAGDSPFLLYNIIVWLSVIISSFIDNIPYSMAMISGIQILSERLALNPFIFLFGLLLGTCAGGNITPVGASCNIATVGLLKKNGFRVCFRDFFRIGLPFTILAVGVSSLLMWIVY